MDNNKVVDVEFGWIGLLESGKEKESPLICQLLCCVRLSPLCRMWQYQRFFTGIWRCQEFFLISNNSIISQE